MKEEARYIYDDAGSQIQKIDVRNQKIWYAYDENRTMIRETAGGVVVSYAYNTGGAFVEMLDGKGLLVRCLKGPAAEAHWLYA